MDMFDDLFKNTNAYLSNPSDEAGRTVLVKKGKLLILPLAAFDLKERAELDKQSPGKAGTYFKMSEVGETTTLRIYPGKGSRKFIKAMATVAGTTPGEATVPFLLTEVSLSYCDAWKKKQIVSRMEFENKIKLTFWIGGHNMTPRQRRLCAALNIYLYQKCKHPFPRWKRPEDKPEWPDE